MGENLSKETDSVLTILTPTYNRATTLPRLYHSLCKQTNQKFEWLVIDDGSQDETALLLEEYQSASLFPIRYYSKPNGGKHTALNQGVGMAKDEWIFIVDSDDVLPADAVNLILHETELITAEFVGICFRKATLDGQIVGTPIERLKPEEVLTPTEAGHLYAGDLAYIFKTSSMRQHLFPVIPDEKFVPELYIWNRISDFGLIKFFGQQCVYLCEYLPDGYSHNFSQNLKNNPKGFALHYGAQCYRESRFIPKLKAAIRWLQCQWYISRNVL